MADEQECDFSVSFKALVVSSDPKCLESVRTLLSQFKFQVTTTGSGAEATALLQEDIDKYDCVICDEHVADMDAPMLVQVMGIRMRKPTAYIGTGDYYELFCRVQFGARWRFCKPLDLEKFKEIPRYLLWCMRQKVESLDIEEDSSSDDEPFEMMRTDDVWSSGVHHKFVAAIKAMGDKANPEAVMDFMNVEGLSKRHVMGQLDRYRLQQVTPHSVIPPL